MIDNQKNKIYSIQNTSNTDLVEIETVILGGLYRFSILGMNQKYSSDTKDRVYSALRTQKILNLKSNNKKITVNLLPIQVDKKDSFYDLGIALGCMINMGEIDLKEDVLVIGELSISGNIIPTKKILKVIYNAINNNIKTIICSNEELSDLKKFNTEILNTALNNNIKFITGNTLYDVADGIKRSKYTAVESKKDKVNTQKPENILNMNIKNESIFKIILALASNKNIFIENDNNLFLQKFVKNLYYYSPKLNSYSILKMSNILNKDDNEILEKYTYPVISEIHKQTPKNNIYQILNESCFGCNFIEDFTAINEDIFHIIKTSNISPVVCFYNNCPCGNGNIFFNNIDTNKCYCLQRNIILHKQRLIKQENGFFDIYIKNTDTYDLNYKAEDYIRINNIINVFKNNNFDLNFSEIDNYPFNSKYDQKTIDLIKNTTKDITKLKFILNKEKPISLIQDIGLAEEFIKKDF